MQEYVQIAELQYQQSLIEMSSIVSHAMIHSRAIVILFVLIHSSIASEMKC